MEPDLITISTLQPECVWTRLKKEKALLVDPVLALTDGAAEYYESPYAWMRGQMLKRVPGYGSGWPWWGWVAPKCDLRQKRHNFLDDEVNVRITLRLPREQVLVSDFQAWHLILNDSYVSLDAAEDDAFDQKCDSAYYDAACAIAPDYGVQIPAVQFDIPDAQFRVRAAVNRVLDPLYRADPGCYEAIHERINVRLAEFTAQKVASWERIFDFEAISSSSEWLGHGKCRQGCFEMLRLSDVVKVARFVGTRNRAKEEREAAEV